MLPGQIKCKHFACPDRHHYIPGGYIMTSVKLRSNPEISLITEEDSCSWQTPLFSPAGSDKM